MPTSAREGPRQWAREPPETAVDSQTARLPAGGLDPSCQRRARATDRCGGGEGEGRLRRRLVDATRLMPFRVAHPGSAKNAEGGL
jgi:hypothetical protein